MPLYEYRCPVCGRVSEVLRRGATVVLTACCGQPLVRIPSRFAQLNPLTGAALRSTFSLYQEATQEIDAAYTRVEAIEERPIEAPNLWLEAKASAKAITDAGEAPTLTSPFQ